ncbi:MAG: hypothetical protein J6V82_02500 [Clostridia bacterium]|nr:hypothetical protein [Clostridia bacterium]MBO7150600.1 hypothetical protein [Clostridia bacterium]
MILKGKQTNVAYRCPGCGYAIFGLVGAFSVSAGLLKLKCQCGDSQMILQFTADKKVRVTVPCLFCGTDHQFTVSQSLFFERDIFALNCPYTNMDICFIGEKEKIDEALEKSAKELELLFEQVTELSDDELTPEQILPDAQIYDILRFVVKELEAEQKIECPCQTGPYELDITADGIRVYCTECGASYLFPSDSVASAEAFLHADSLHLVYTP